MHHIDHEPLDTIIGTICLIIGFAFLAWVAIDKGPEPPRQITGTVLVKNNTQGEATK